MSRMAHALAGFLSSASVIVDPMLSLLGFAIFAAYQCSQWKAKGDPPHEEFLDYAVGFYAGVLILILIFGFDSNKFARRTARESRT